MTMFKKTGAVILLYFTILSSITCNFAVPFQSQQSLSSFENLDQFWEVYQRKFPSTEPVQVHHDETVRIDPQCGSEYSLEKDLTNFKLEIREQKSGCSYTLKNKDARALSIVCASLSPKARQDSASCAQEDILIKHSEKAHVYCGDRLVFSLPSNFLRSEMQYVSCAIIVEDSEEDRNKGAVSAEDYKFTPQPCPRTCGIQSYQPSEQQNRIIGGESAKPGEFPWQSLIVSQGYQEGETMCGGSLLNSRYVLSAAHCFKGEQFLAVKFTAVILGLNNITELASSSDVQIFKGVKIIVHPGYDYQLIINDLALVQLDRDVIWTSKIAPICLSSPNDDFSSQTSLVSGFGVSKYNDDKPQESELPEVLQKAALRILSPAECTLAFTLFDVTITDIGQVCTKGYMQDSCKGDSGGPVVVRNESGRFVQVGIVSWGAGCNDPLLPSVNTRVSGYRQWIVRTISGVQSATCG